MAGNGRFHIPNEDELQDILSKKDAVNTKKTTATAVKCFRDFLRQSGRENVEFETYPPEELDRTLKQFYYGARKTDGSYFKKSALQYIKYSLNRYVKEKTKMDIIKDTSFNDSNQIFQAVSTDLKRKGFGKVDHHPPISDQDLQKLYSDETHVFDLNTPYGLQRKVWFEITLYLCRRRRENLRNMTKDTFKIGTDDTGRQYIFQAVDELDKNHRANSTSTDSVTEGRMYEIKGSKHCPVASFQKYLSKLNPKRNDLWQRPRDSFLQDDSTWYCDSPLGKNWLCELMAVISKTAKLSQVYKNHSVRATSITVLDTGGISGRHILRISGHKSETSLKSYSHHVSDAKKREISDTFSNALCPVPKKQVPLMSNNELPSVDPLNDISNIFSDEYEFENVNQTYNGVDDVDLSNVLENLPSPQNTLPSPQNTNMQISGSKQIDGSSHGVFYFRPAFAENCTVHININNYGPK